VNGEILHMKVAAPGGRLDHVLTGRWKAFSRSRLQQLIRQGYVLVNGRPVSKPAYRLEGGETVELQLPAPRPSELIPEDISLAIVYEDENVLVIDKPAGMVVHPSAGHDHGTLVHAALAHAPDMAGVGGERRPGVVHRLDKDTSGLIMLAKNDRAHYSLQKQFKHRSVEKRYIALVDGAPSAAAGVVQAAIGRDPKNRKRMSILPKGGREAETTYRTLESFAGHTLLELKPHSGRTHQIRLHMAFLGCPVVGDRVYGKRKPSLPLQRHFLHASRLTITLPGEDQPATFHSPLPADLEQLLAELRKRG
jgi:23S rRNA pseudouridine1911/1915/1917 synthase